MSDVGPPLLALNQALSDLPRCQVEPSMGWGPPAKGALKEPAAVVTPPQHLRPRRHAVHDPCEVAELSMPEDIEAISEHLGRRRSPQAEAPRGRAHPLRVP